MTPVTVECAACSERFPLSISRLEAEAAARCPRCGRQEVLLAALAGEERAAVLPFRRPADEVQSVEHDGETGRADGTGGRT